MRRPRGHRAADKPPGWADCGGGVGAAGGKGRTIEVQRFPSHHRTMVGSAGSSIPPLRRCVRLHVIPLAPADALELTSSQ